MRIRPRSAVFAACPVLLFSFLLVTKGTAALARGGSPSTHLNVILVYSDDISARELPIYGSTVWSDARGNDTSNPAHLAGTPNLDRIAEEGA